MYLHLLLYLDVWFLKVSVAYVVQATGAPKPGSEEEAVVSIPRDKIGEHLSEFAFDHSQVTILVFVPL